jgi:hypothetical protein
MQRICTRSVNELVKALGMGRISKSQVSRLCAKIDEPVSAFLGRPIEGDWPYLWIDATCVKIREAGGIVSVAAMIAVGVNTDDRREVLGRPGAGLPQSVAGTRCAGSHVPASARPARRRTSPQLRAPSVAQRRSRSSRKRSVSEPLSRRSSSAILSMVIVVFARCWFRFGNPTLPAIRDDRFARGAPRPCSLASCRSAAGTTSSASQLSPMPFSIASCTTPSASSSRATPCASASALPHDARPVGPWRPRARRPVSHGEGHVPAA